MLKNVLLIVLIGVTTGFSQTNRLRYLDHQTYTRKVLVHLPPSYSADTMFPLVIFLHGGNGNVKSAQRFTLFNQVANINDFIMAYPQGYYETKDNGFVWADGRGTGADLAGIDDVGFIDKMVDSLLSDYNIDANKVYCCGFSNGSFMTQRVAFEANEKFAAMGTIGGTLDSVLYHTGQPNRPLPMLYILGTKDPYVPYNGGHVAESETIPVVGIKKAVRFWVTNNNCSTALDSINLPDRDLTDHSTVTMFEYIDCDCNANVLFYKVTGGGHTWPGVELVLQEAILGETNEDIFASEELWSFFKDHSLCSHTDVDKPMSPSTFSLLQNTPNPFNSSTTIQYTLDAPDHIKLTVYDVLGKEIVSLVNTFQTSGKHTVHFDAGELSSGTFFYTLSNGTITRTRQMIFLK